MRSTWKECEACDMHVPLLSVHCSHCRKCIYALDHHCYFLGHCIGRGNQRFFIVFCHTRSFQKALISKKQKKYFLLNFIFVKPGIGAIPNHTLAFLEEGGSINEEGHYFECWSNFGKNGIWFSIFKLNNPNCPWQL